MSGNICYFGKEYHALKTALHTHTTLSDGEFTPEELIRCSEELGYDVLSITDHRKVAPVSQWKSSMLLIPGMEFHPDGPRGIPWHIVSYGIPEQLEDLSPLPVQEGIDRVISLGGVCHAAHPSWSEIRSTDIMKLKNISGVEIFNSGATEIGRGESQQTLIELWSARRYLQPLSVDDVHHKKMLGIGWTMVLAEERTQASVLEAIRAGRVYATTGPEFTKFEYDGTVFHAEFTKCASAMLIMAGPQAYYLPCQARKDLQSGKKNCSYSEITADLAKLPDDLYLSVHILDKKGKSAWSAPFRKKKGKLVF